MMQFLRDHGIERTEKGWVIYGKYHYTELTQLLYKEDLIPLMEEVYKIPLSEAKKLDGLFTKASS